MAVIYLQKLLRGRVVQNMVCRVDPWPLSSPLRLDSESAPVLISVG